jgi:hypothetical protein
MYVGFSPQPLTSLAYVYKSDLSDHVSIAVDSSNYLLLRHGVTTVAFDSCPVNQWIDVEIDLTSGQSDAWLYSGGTQFSQNHADADFTLSGAGVTGNFGEVRYGRPTSLGSSRIVHFGYVSNVTDSETPSVYSAPTTASANAATATASSSLDAPTKLISPVAEQSAATGVGNAATINTTANSTLDQVGAALALGVASPATTTAMRQYQLFRNASGLIVPV